MSPSFPSSPFPFSPQWPKSVSWPSACHLFCETVATLFFFSVSGDMPCLLEFWRSNPLFSSRREPTLRCRLTYCIDCFFLFLSYKTFFPFSILVEREGPSSPPPPLELDSRTSLLFICPPFNFKGPSCSSFRVFETPPFPFLPFFTQIYRPRLLRFRFACRSLAVLFFLANRVGHKLFVFSDSHLRGYFRLPAGVGNQGSSLTHFFFWLRASLFPAFYAYRPELPSQDGFQL